MAAKRSATPTPLPRGELLRALDAIAPPRLALEWDNVGLLVAGDDAITGVLCALDITEQVIAEAVKKGANAVVAHHPLIFHPLRHLRGEDDVQRAVAAAIRAGVNCVAAHTNLDAAPRGCNATLAALLELEDAAPLQPDVVEPWRKIAVFTPADHVERVRRAMSAAGAGRIGEYDECSFELAGTGTFRPGARAQPYSGTRGTLAREAEVRLEMLVAESAVPAVIDAMVAAHPYEEVAYDVFVLANPGRPAGVLWRGALAKAESADAFTARVKAALGVETVRAAYGARRVRTVALCSGAGGSFITNWPAAVADAYVTGDVSYHQMQRAVALGITVVDPGHGPTEQPAVRALAAQLRAALAGLPVAVARTSTDPVRFV